MPEINLTYVGELADLLARRILGALDRGEFTRHDLRASPEIDRIGDVANWLTRAGEDVPISMRELIHKAEAAGWRRRSTRESEAQEPSDIGVL